VYKYAIDPFIDPLFVSDNEVAVFSDDLDETLNLRSDPTGKSIRAKKDILLVAVYQEEPHCIYSPCEVAMIFS